MGRSKTQSRERIQQHDVEDMPDVVVELSSQNVGQAVEPRQILRTDSASEELPGEAPLSQESPQLVRPSLRSPVAVPNSSQVWLKKRVKKVKRRDTAARVLGFVISAAYVGVGASAFLYIQPTYQSQGNEVANMTYIDAIYFTTITLTTVGYGDITPSSVAAKVFVCAFIMGAVVLVAAMNDVVNFALSIETEWSHGNSASRAVGGLEDDSEDEDEGSGRTMHWTEEEVRVCYLSKSRRIMLGAALALTASLVSGMLFFTYVEGMNVLDALYFSIVTLTTVGYGDMRPISREAKLFSIAWITVGIFGLYRAIRAFTQVALEKRKRSWRLRLQRRRERIHDKIRDHVRSMNARNSLVVGVEEAGEGGIERVSEAEFILFGLEQLGKIRTEDIRAMLARYQQLESSDTLITREMSNRRSIFGMEA